MYIILYQTNKLYFFLFKINTKYNQKHKRFGSRIEEQNVENMKVKYRKVSSMANQLFLV